MKRNYINSILACCVIALSFTACADVWDEHYHANPALNGDETLWELIDADSELTEFAALLKATGYDTLLQKNRSYTVWAPINGSGFLADANSLESASAEQLAIYVKEIVQNHIANYSHVAGGVRDKEDTKNYKMVKMLNDKSYHFVGNAVTGYTFSGKEMKEVNVVAKNGVLHKLNGYTGFAANIWEQLAKEESIDSLYAFLIKDYKREFNANASIPGPVVDGQVTWLDSSFTESCRWFPEIGYLDLEDSLYTMYALTNRAWVEMYEMTREYFAYPQTMKTLPAKGNQTSDQAADSVVKEMMVRNLVFSDIINRKYPEGDTLVSNYRYGKTRFVGEEVEKLNNGLVKELSLSNGTLKIVDSVNYNPFTCWHDTIRIQGESLVNQQGQPVPLYTNANKNVAVIHRDSLLYDSISGGAIGVYEAVAGQKNPVFNFYINDVLSSYYEIKLVLLPPQIIDPLDTVFIKPNKFVARLYTGDGMNINLGTFVSNPAKIDTITLAECVKVPTCEYQLKGLSGNDPLTRLNIESDIYFTGTRGDGENKGDVKLASRWNYDNSFRIDQVIVNPVKPIGE